MHFHPRCLRSRTFWLKLHVYPALGAGLLFVLLGISGSLAVYGEELDRLLNPRLEAPRLARDRLPLDRIVAAAQEAHPRRYAPWTLEMPHTPDGVITAWYSRPEETADRSYAPLMVAVNPYTGEVVASRFWGETTATWLVDLHTRLLADRGGWSVVGILGLLMMLSAASGLRLWWPGLGGLRRAFGVSCDAGIMRLSLDVHRLAGFFGSAWLLLMAFTGFSLAFPGFAEALAGSSGMAHGNEGKEIRSTAIPNDRPVSMAEAVLIARGPFPHAEVRRVFAPAGETGSYRVNLRQQGEVNQRHPFTTVWVDRWSGQILDVRNPKRFTGGETFLAWLWPLHTGEAYGAGGRLAWFFAGFIPLALYATGLLRWLHGKGWVMDREVNIAPLFEHLRRHARRTGRRCLERLPTILAWLRDASIHVLLRLQRTLERYSGRSQRKGQ